MWHFNKLFYYYYYYYVPYSQPVDIFYIIQMSLRKHAYSNILKIWPPKMKIFR